MPEQHEFFDYTTLIPKRFSLRSNGFGSRELTSKSGIDGPFMAHEARFAERAKTPATLPWSYRLKFFLRGPFSAVFVTEAGRQWPASDADGHARAS